MEDYSWNRMLASVLLRLIKFKLMSNWQNDIDDWTKVSKETAEFYIHLAETRLNEQVKTADIITSRTDRLLGISVTFITILLGYIFSEDWHLWNCDVFISSSFIAVMILIYVNVQLVQNLLPFNIRIPGEDPRLIVNKKFIENNYDSHEQFINLILNQLNNYQNRIDLNVQTNSNRMVRNTRALWGLVSLPFSLIVGYLLTWIF